MRVRLLLFALVVIGLSTPARPDAQQAGMNRLAPDVFDVVPPSALVRGEPGRMTLRSPECRTLPPDETRRRIVDVAVQEWAFFGFRIVDQAIDTSGARRRGARLGTAEAARVAASIAGYWAVTPEGAWIVERQNDRWNGTRDIGARWNAPWSAAFVSWVMCEAGLGSTNRFRRAVAHHSYIDQAIRARDGGASQAAFTAHDAGEIAIEPGDLICSSRRPIYRTLAERRRQIGVGARSHCDIVVGVDEAGGRILAIGGNVRGTVSLKLFPAVRHAGEPFRLAGAGNGDRPMFAHLKLRAASIEANALGASPTVSAVGCVTGLSAATRMVAANLGAAGVRALRC
ncbi:MAG: DUF2272 domain-containing protein [Acidobacteria bacterium]|nr:DUF2272 domain-containing protein [Acidobacteriota bacterium]